MAPSPGFSVSETITRLDNGLTIATDRVGGDINAFTAKEYTAYYCRLPARHTGYGIELLGDALTHSELTDKDVESERQVILEELAMDDDSPDDVALRRLTNELFPDHGLGRDTAGTRRTVVDTTADDVREFFGAHYGAPGTVVSVAGDIVHDDIVDAVAAAFADISADDGRVERTPPGDVGADASIRDESEQVHLAIGGRALPRQHPDREALDVVNHVFGGGLSSRLFDEIRERRGLAYSVYSATAAYADAGAWTVYAGTMPEYAAEVHGLVRREIDRLVSDGISDEELAVAVGYLTGAYEMGLEDSGARMSRLGGMLVTRGEVRSVDEQIGRWEAVTVADVRRVIADVLAAAAPITVAVGPDVTL